MPHNCQLPILSLPPTVTLGGTPFYLLPTAPSMRLSRAGWGKEGQSEGQGWEPFGLVSQPEGRHWQPRGGAGVFSMFPLRVATFSKETQEKTKQNKTRQDTQ